MRLLCRDVRSFDCAATNEERIRPKSVFFSHQARANNSSKTLTYYNVLFAIVLWFTNQNASVRYFIIIVKLCMIIKGIY